MSKVQQSDPPEINFPCPRKIRDYLTRLVGWVKECQPIEGIGTTIDDTPQGRVINASGGGGGVAENLHPFKLVKVDNTHIRVIFGTVNSEIPSGMSVGDDPEYVETVGGSGVIYLKASTDANGDITTVVIEHAASMPPDAIGSWKMMIGSFNTVSGNLVIAQNVSGSQALEVCGGVDANWGLV